MIPPDVTIADYTYTLPPDRIAHQPLAERDSSKLLVYQQGTITDNGFSNLPTLLRTGMQVVLNNTRVIAARIFFQKPSGGVIEIFCLEPINAGMEEALQQKSGVEWKCLVGGASKWKPRQLLQKELLIDGVPVTLTADCVGKSGDHFEIGFGWTGNRAFAEVLQAAGAIPLPPYIKRKAEAADSQRYQTIFGHQPGSVAAPTAALHFSEAVFSALAKQQIATNYVTLHVGAGTFQPVKSVTSSGHPMHAESFTVTRAAIEELAEADGLVAVGTTSLRTLESLHWMGVKLASGQEQNAWKLGQWEAYSLPQATTFRESLAAVLAWMNKENVSEVAGRTALLIQPGYRFKTAEALVTNFHQPQSTLLLLVAAFIGDDWRRVYDHALEAGYRFLSYGDSSLLWRSEATNTEM